MSNTLMVAATIVMAIATAAMAWFNCQLVRISDEMKKATRAALHVNRPFLIVAMPEMKVASEEVEKNTLRSVPKCVNISVENFGTGPADIIDISLYTFAFPPLMPDPPVTYKPEDRSPPLVSILGAGKSAEIARLYLDIGKASDVLAVIEERRRLGVYGEIRYRGGPPDEVYLTHFFWWYFPGTPKGQDFSRALTPELNSRT
jgi:hypothetical protein